MKKNIYLIFSIVGIVLPYSQFVPFSREYGFNLETILTQATANYISTGIALDALLAAVTVVIYILFEQRKEKVPHVWVPIVGMFIVGLSFALPCYLYLRELSKHQTERSIKSSD